MAYDQDLAARVRALLAHRAVDEKRMFGGLAFLVQRHLAVAVSGAGGLMVRVAPEATDALLREPGASEMEMHGRAVDGWVRVSDDVLDDAALASWVQRGVTHCESLPPSR